MGALTSYQSQISLLLHDPNNQYFTLPILQGYINEARNRVAQDSKCLRMLIGQSTGVPLNLIPGQDFYTPQTFITGQGQYLVDVMGISIWWGTQRIKLGYKSYTEFDAIFRGLSTYTGQPRCFTRMGANNVVVGPAPDQAYPTDWDIAVIPAPLVSDATVEQIPVPFQEPVQYYAAFKAKFQEQALGEANIFKAQYTQNLSWCSRAFVTRIIQNPYRIGA